MTNYFVHRQGYIQPKMIFGAVGLLTLLIVLGFAVWRIQDIKTLLSRPKATGGACQTGRATNLQILNGGTKTPTIFWDWQTGFEPSGAASMATVFLWNCNPSVSSCLATPQAVAQVAGKKVRVQDFIKQADKGNFNEFDSGNHWLLVQGDGCDQNCCTQGQLAAGYKCLPRCGGGGAYTCAAPAEVTAAQNGCVGGEKRAFSLGVELSGDGGVRDSLGHIGCNQNNLGGGGTCSVPWNPSSVVTLTATPDSGSSFSSWGGACSGSSPTCTVTMDVAKTVTATFTSNQPQQFTLGIGFVNTGSSIGVVTSNPSGINCSSQNTGNGCSATFSSGTQITLQATPGTNSSFYRWLGACTGNSSSCTFAIDGNKSVEADFSQTQAQQYTLTITKPTLGAIVILKPSDSTYAKACGSDRNNNDFNDCSLQFDAGTVLSLGTSPKDNVTFSGWTGGVCTVNANNTCSLTMDTNKTVGANFVASQQHTLTVTSSPNGKIAGTVDGSYVINCGDGGSNCTSTFDSVKTYVLTVIPGPNNTFTGWTGACSGANTTCTLVVDSAKTVGATFIQTTNSYVLGVTFAGSGFTGGEAQGVVSSNPSGINCSGVSGSVPTGTCEAVFNSGTQVTLTATPATGSVFSTWLTDCSGSATTCQIIMNANKHADTAWTKAQ